MDSYDVRFWDTKKIGDNASGGRYRVRWAIDGQEHCTMWDSGADGGRRGRAVGDTRDEGPLAVQDLGDHEQSTCGGRGAGLDLKNRC
jgi:hypothetical protein